MLKRFSSLIAILALANCSAMQSGETASSHVDAASQSPPTLLTFSGSFNASTGEVTIVVDKHPDAVLPYGTSAGEVYFHTCSTKYTQVGAGGYLTGVVQAVNQMVGIVPDLAVSIYDISDTGTTFSGTPLSGGVVNTWDTSCTANLSTWTFTQVATTNFTFSGSATGTVPTRAPFQSDASVPTVVVFIGGDSITAPSGVWGNSYPILVEPRLGNGAIVNDYAVPGDNCGQVDGTFNTEIRPQIPALLEAGVPTFTQFSVELMI